MKIKIGARHARSLTATTVFAVSLLTSTFAAQVALAADGSVSCWGGGTTVAPIFPEFGQSIVPANLSTCTAVSGGWMHSLALRADGAPVGWGSTTNNLGTVVNQSVIPAGVGTCTAVAAGFYHSMVLRSTGFVTAWGDNRFGQSAVPGALGTCTKIASGGYHCVALKSTGAVACWGAGTVDGGVAPDYGQSAVPAGLGVCTQISAGGYHTAVIKADGTLSIWGQNIYGQRTIPAGLGTCTQVACGDLHTVALKSDGNVVCWGAGTTATNNFQEYGQSIVPAGLGTCTQIAAGGYVTMVIKSNGSIATWGSNSTAVGVDPNFGQSTLPSVLAEPGMAVAIAVGGRHSMAISKTRQVPSQYTTIQAAINASAAGDRVVVAAGTYNQAFALLGKNVVVRGAANNATIVTGNGLTSSIATFSGGEPATAGVESLFFRSGTSGNAIAPPGTMTRGGGGLYGRNSSAHITNCRFEDCHSENGGGVYMLDCAVNWSGCAFHSNSCDTDGGGAQVYRCSGTVTNCTFTDNLSGLIASGGGSGFKAVGALVTGQTIELNGCTFTGNMSSVSGSAIEYYENVKWNPGVMRLTGCTVTNNRSGIAVVSGAGGLRVLGDMDCCYVTNSTNICNNMQTEVSGPYYMQGSVTVCDCHADLSGDGAVNGADLGILLAAWGITDAEGTGDANHDGLVNAADVSIVLSSWGVCN